METNPDLNFQTDFFKLNRWLLKNNRQLYDKLAFYNEMYSQLKVALYIYDLTENKHIWSNNNYEKITGYTREELSRLGPQGEKEIYHKEDRNILKQRCEFYRENKGNSYCCVFRAKHKEGHWVWIYSSSVVYKRDQYGKPAQIFGLEVNLTESCISNVLLNDVKEKAKTNEPAFPGIYNMNNAKQ
ncbi:MAG: PAS domain-containing protein [Bacteroidales bacterium]|nr:PAS domain-containing protein [Bacteroidales bacterium]